MVCKYSSLSLIPASGTQFLMSCNEPTAVTRADRPPPPPPPPPQTSWVILLLFWPMTRLIQGWCILTCIADPFSQFQRLHIHISMMTSPNGDLFRVTGPLCRESTGDQWIALTKTSNAELWCFLWSAPEQTAEETIKTPGFETPSRSLWRHCNVSYFTCLYAPLHFLYRAFFVAFVHFVLFLHAPMECNVEDM